jgi:hypothetical protein
MEKRYCNCSWIVKRWRDRYLLLVPFVACKGYIRSYIIHGNKEPFSFFWDCAEANADLYRLNYYTAEETRVYFERKGKEGDLR